MTLKEIIRELESFGLSMDKISKQTSISRSSLFRYKRGCKPKNETMIKQILLSLLKKQQKSIKN